MTQDPKPKAVRSRLRRYLPGLLFLIVLGVVVYLGWRLLFAGTAAPANVIALSGRIEGDPAAVAAKLSGRILEVRVREGDLVNAGDVIAVLDDEQIRAREDQAKAGVADAEAKAEAANAQIAVLQEQLRQSELLDRKSTRLNSSH